MICEYYDVYFDDTFIRRIHYWGYIGRFIKDNGLEGATIRKGEFHV